MAAGSVATKPPVTNTPNPASGSLKRAPSAAKTMSAFIIHSKPAPTVQPCTAAMTGQRCATMARETACTSSRSLSVGAALTSRPAQKARPLPRRRMARTAGSVAAALSASSRASASGLSMALSLSGRLSVSVRTPASDVQRSVDVEGMAQSDRMAALRT